MMKQTTRLMVAISLCITAGSVHADQDKGRVITQNDLEYSSKLDIALRHAQQNSYDKAFPVLLQYAKYGEKLAQNIVGTYMLAGVGTEENIAEGLTWMGLALEQEDVTWKKHFESLTQNLNATQQQQLNQQIENYRSKYGVKAQMMVCRMEAKQLGSNIKVHRCKKIRDKENQVQIREFD